MPVSVQEHPNMVARETPSPKGAITYTTVLSVQRDNRTFEVDLPRSSSTRFAPAVYAECIHVDDSAAPQYTTACDVHKRKQSRMKAKVQVKPKLTQERFSDSIICFRRSPLKLFTSSVECKKGIETVFYGDTVYVIPPWTETTHIARVYFDSKRQKCTSSVSMATKAYSSTRVHHFGTPFACTDGPRVTHIENNCGGVGGWYSQI
ncbi:hypothetical protein CAPTEDRAFT_219594 [Capitella teleta]|uniref:Uncharacterized protein n=1 Tax=Capitella teleta TaxID=283909 RepID=R7UDT2_CAPTE|nr:hypothetical protein CAPTEDRAFT_219594 [Capitella teleta]|eukprot:ELU04154.1 hypothetical protein CAPTEDRAFT_219594 [Capitella teleta]